MAIQPETESDQELAVFYDDVASHDLQPLWTQVRDLMPTSPRPSTRPHIWRWATMRRLAERSGQLVPIERGGDRRVLALANPGLGGLPYAASTLWAAVQYLGGHERAPAHRHTAGALRFVLEGEGVWTTVDGDACDMRPGDVVLTPRWNWHDHCNGRDEPMLWFDGLDIPLVNALDASFFELSPTPEPQLIEGDHNRSQRLYGWAGLRPVGFPDTRSDASPLLSYRWEETDRALASLVGESAGAAAVEFTNPATGASALPTLGASMHRILAQATSRPHRQVGHRVIVVYRGHGTSTVGDLELTWGPHDMFVVPSWYLVRHRAQVDSDLFVLSDEPVIRTLGLFRQEWIDDLAAV
jgi:gentisate 1,2-dioxygenase